jgi:hypothetical protein
LIESAYISLKLFRNKNENMHKCLFTEIGDIITKIFLK